MLDPLVDLVMDLARDWEEVVSTPARAPLSPPATPAPPVITPGRLRPVSTLALPTTSGWAEEGPATTGLA